MKKASLSLLVIMAFNLHAQEPLYDQVIFDNSRMTGHYYYSETSYQSPSWIKNVQHKLPVFDAASFTPGNSLQLHYVNGNNGHWEASIIKPVYRGQDKVREADALIFRIFIQSATTLINHLPNIKLGLENSTYSDSVSLQKYIKNFSTGKWATVVIPLADFRNAKSVPIMAIYFLQPGNDGLEHRLLLDQLEMLPVNLPSFTRVSPSLSSAKGSARHIDISWNPINDSTIKYIKVYRSTDGNNFAPVGIMMPSRNRFTDFVGETGRLYQYKITAVGYDYSESNYSSTLTAVIRKLTDDQLLTMVQESCFRYYWEGAESVSGLAKENIPGRKNMIATGAAGFGMMALIVGAERNFITRKQAVDRFLQITRFLEGTETFHGAFSHFVDGPTRKVEPFFGNRDNGGDLVETSFLMQGLLAARAYFNKNDVNENRIRESITRLWEKVEWSWYLKDPSSKYLYWHWSPDQGWVINHNLIGWNETMITYLLAIASPSHPVKPSLYYSGWASQDSIAQQYRKGWGETPDGSMYSNGKVFKGISLEVGVSNGGPLFFIHYSYLAVDPHQITDAYTNYFRNNRNIALINYRYCIENPGKYQGYSDSCWGLTASDGPGGYSANEPVLRMDNAKMAPTGAISSFPYTPKSR
ncbi:MAG: glucoamylase family protein [Chitinophagaceae bacterium]